MSGPVEQPETPSRDLPVETPTLNDAEELADARERSAALRERAVIEAARAVVDRGSWERWKTVPALDRALRALDEWEA